MRCCNRRVAETATRTIAGFFCLRGLAMMIAVSLVTHVECATAPAQVSPAPIVCCLGSTSLVVSWTAPASNGAAITGYQIQLQVGGSGPFTVQTANTQSNATTATLNGLQAARQYAFQIAAINSVASGPVSLPSQIAIAGSSTLPCATVVEYPIPTSASVPHQMILGPDNNLWFGEYNVAAGKIARITPAGVVTEFATGSSGVWGITIGPDSQIWFTDWNGNFVGRCTLTGSLTQFSIPTANVRPTGIVAGPDSALWFCQSAGNAIGRVTVGGIFSAYPLPTPGAWPVHIIVGFDSQLWFTQALANKIGRMTTSGVLTAEYTLPSAHCFPVGLARGPDNAIWFAEANSTSVGRISLAGVVTEFPVFGAVTNFGVLQTPVSDNSYFLTVGPDQAIWFSAPGLNRIGRITTAGILSEYNLPTLAAAPAGIVTGPDNRIWFTEFVGNNVGRMPAGPSQGSPPDVSCPLGANAIALSWTAPASNGSPITGYQILMQIGGENSTLVHSTQSNQTTASFSNLQYGQWFAFQIFAINSIGAGPTSAASAATNCQPPVLLSVSPSISPLSGNATCVILGTNVFPGVSLSVSNQTVQLITNISSPSGVSSLYFRSPALPASASGRGFYARLVLTNPMGTFTTNITSLYYIGAESNCLSPGQLWTDSACVSCPTGAYCPGGDRVWPIQGYWSPNEYTNPQPCAFAAACPGVYPFDPANPPAFHSDGTLVTTSCASGYNGEFCSQCVSGYYAQSVVCNPCAGTASDQAELTGVFVIGVILVLVIAIAATVLNDEHMGNVVGGIIVLQRVAVVGGIAAAQFANTKAGTLFLYLSLLNLNIEIAKPGCSIPIIPFVNLFWDTIAFVVWTAAVFIVAAAVRAYCVSAKQLQESGVGRFKIFKRRSIHSMIILGCLAYLQVTSRIFQGISCTSVNGSMRLRADLSLQCYSDFPATAFFNFLFLFLYSLGFPVACLFLVYRGIQAKRGRSQAVDTPSHSRTGSRPEDAVHIGAETGSGQPTIGRQSTARVIHERLHEPKRSSKYGFLYRQLKDKFWWYCAATFVTSFFLALQTATAPSISLRAFLSVLCFSVGILGTGIYVPYKRWFDNLTSFAASYASGIQVLIYLALLQPGQDTADKDMLFAITLSLLLLMGAVVGLYRLYRFTRANRPQQFATLTSCLQQCTRRKSTTSREESNVQMSERI